MLSDSDNGNLDDKRMASASSSKLNEQQQQQIPSSRRPFASEGAEGREQFEGSGSPNPDDEDGDTGEGSGGKHFCFFEYFYNFKKMSRWIRRIRHSASREWWQRWLTFTE
jgi:hypothetical protein